MHSLCSVTVARAMNAKQDNTLISSISNQISQYFDMGGKKNKKRTSTIISLRCQTLLIIPLGQQLASLDEKIVGQWRMYFGLKSKFYLAEVSETEMIEKFFENEEKPDLGTRISSVGFS